MISIKKVGMIFFVYVSTEVIYQMKYGETRRPTAL
jgi:hypothetical protein